MTTALLAARTPDVVAVMTVDDIWVFLLLGLGTGAAYAIAGIGLVQIYRGSGVINFAHGAIAFLSVALYGQFSVIWDWPWPLAFALSWLAAIAAGALIQLAVMRPLRQATVLVKIIATVGVLAIIEELVPLVLGNITQRAQNVDPWSPSGGVTLQPGAVLGFDRLIMTGIAIALGAGMWKLMSATRFGLETTAVAEDELTAQALRVNPNRVALLNWMLGGGLAGLAGLLWSSWTGLRVEPYILLVVPALAAALIGKFDSFPLTVAGGLGLGMVRELIFRWQTDPDIGLPDGLTQGWNDALPFIVILGLLAARGSVFPDRGESISVLPAVGRARLSLPTAAALAVVLPAVTLLATDDLALAITATTGVAVVGLSLVVVTGLAGQVSLAQMAMAGIGALVAAQLSATAGVPILLLLPIAAVSGALAGAVFALPALRSRGPALAVATIALGLAVQRTVFGNASISGASFSGLEIEPPNLFGWSIDGVSHPERFAACGVVVAIVALLAVSNLRAGPVGRRFLAVRSNERAAAALGISISATKVTAFVMSAGLAAVGGLLLTFNRNFVQVTGAFGFGQSLLALVLALIGGIGFLLGPVVGGALSPAGLVPWVFNDIDAIERLLIVVAGVIVVIQLIVAPNGIVHQIVTRQSDMPDLRNAVGSRRSAWRWIGGAEMAGGLATLVGVIGQRFESSLPFEAIRITGGVGLAVLMGLAIRRHRSRGHPMVALVPASVFLILISLSLGLPRIASPLLDVGPDANPATAIGLWLGLATLAGTAGAIWVDRRRDLEVQARLPLGWMVAGIATGAFLLASTFSAEILHNLFGMIVGVLFTTFGVGKLKPEDGYRRTAVDFVIADPADTDADVSVDVDTDADVDVDVEPTDATLHVRGLTVRYGPVLALDQLHLEVRPGEIVGLIGPNGAGKTTAIDAINGFVDITDGTVALGPADLTSRSVHQRSRLGLGRTFQTVEPFDDLSVVENLAAATEHVGCIDWVLSPFRVPTLKLSAATADVIDAFELDRELSSMPDELPQGRRRLLGVARAVASSPAVMLLDEPAAGLSATETEQLGVILRRVADDMGVGMLLVEHDMSIVTAICDHVVALDFGRTIFSGPPNAVLTDPTIRRAYLGHDLEETESESHSESDSVTTESKITA